MLHQRRPALDRPVWTSLGLQRGSRTLQIALALGSGSLLALNALAQAVATPADSPEPKSVPKSAVVEVKSAEAKDGEVVELSPFVVTSDKDVGYQASSTLAGTRLNTDIKDVGAAVSVYTAEFLQDINVTKLEDILTYTASTEAGGQNGNYSGIASGENAAETRDDPSSVNRVRALASATRTRDFFATDIPTDTFSYENLTISRGPNAILAGVGNAGGIIDSAMRKATFKDNYRVNSRISSYGSHREEVHLNKVIIPKKLAIRLDLLNDDQSFRQKPAFSNDQRLYAAMQYRVFEPKRGSWLGRGTFRGNFEQGKIKGIPPDNITPTTYMDNWFLPTSRTVYDATTGETTPGVQVPGNAKYYWDPTANNGSGSTFTSTGGTLVTAPAPTTANPAATTTGVTTGFPLFSSWALIFADPTNPTAKVDPTGTVPALNGVQGFVGSVPRTITSLLPLGPGGGLRASGDPDRLRLGFYKDHLSDPRIFDFYNNLLTGGLDYRRQKFKAMDFRYEQLFWNGKAGLELAYNDQSFTRYRNFAVANGNDEGIYIDVNKYLTVLSDNATYPNAPGLLTPPVNVATVQVLNPNFGRPFISTQDAFKDQQNRIDRESYQLTTFLKHDFSQSKSSLAQMLGSHTLSTLFFKTTIDRSNRTYSSTWDPAGGLNTSGLGDTGSFGAQVNAWFYIGPSLVNTASVSDVRLQSINANPQYGSSYTLRVWDPATRRFTTGSSTPQRILSKAVDQREDLSSNAIALQSNFFKNHVVTVFGWREDSDDNLTTGTPPRLANGNLDLTQLTYLPSASVVKRTWTKSVVARLPGRLPGDTQIRAYWNEAGNFNPVGQRRNIWNEEVGSASASTEEKGISISTFNGKLFLRVNQFVTRIKNDSVAVPNPYSYISSTIASMIRARENGLTPFDFGYRYSSTIPVSSITAATNEWQSFNDVAKAFYDSIPKRLKDRIGPQFNFNPRFTGSGSTMRWEPDSIVNLTSLSDTESRGTEYEAIVNPVRGWRIAFSVSKNEAVRTDVAREELAFGNQWINAITTNPVAGSNTTLNPLTLTPDVLQKYMWYRLGFGSRSPGNVATPTGNGQFTANSIGDQYRGEHLDFVRAAASLSGAPTPEIRKWRANFVTRYEFQSGFLRGFSIGGTARWQDRVGIGFPYVSPDPTTVIDGVSYAYKALDKTRPIWGPRDIKFDVSFGYKRRFKVANMPINWNIGVNVRNLNAKDELIPIGANTDGTIGFFRIPPERSWSVSNSFAF